MLNTEKMVSGSITENTTWEAGSTQVLDGIVYVEKGARLTIEPGTRILGRPGSALVVTRGSFLHARGRTDAPIVFTSAQPEGNRRSGDWGGVVLLGGAPVNVTGAHIEGLHADDHRGAYGGDDPAYSCGVLEYSRIETVDFQGDNTAALIDRKILGFNGLLVDRIGHGGITWFANEHLDQDDDGGFDETAWFNAAERRASFGVDPQLPRNADSAGRPTFTPLSHSPLARGAPPPPQGEFWDEAADWLGAIRPGARHTWLDGWTAFAMN